MPARVYLLLFLTCLVAYGGVAQGPNPNSTSRFALTMSLVRSNTVSIDEFADFTGDKAVALGRHVSDKAPGMSLLALPAILAVVRTVEAFGGDTDVLTTRIVDGEIAPAPAPRFWFLQWIATIATSGLFSAAAVVFFCDALIRLGVSKRAALGFAAVFAFGSLQWGWSTAFFSHATTGALLVAAFWALVVATDAATSGRARLAYSAAVGLLLGLAILVEFTAGIAATFLAVFGIARVLPLGARATAASAAVAVLTAAPVLGALALYNSVAFGGPFAVSYASVVGFDEMRTGIFGVGVPSVYVLWEIIFGGDRGILWYTPVLLLFPLGAVFAFRRYPEVVILSVAIVVAYFLINAGYAYWTGGYSTGPRHVAPALAFAILPVALSWGDRPRWQKIVVATLALPGFVANYIAATTNMFSPEIWREIVFFTYMVPTFLSGERVTIVLNDVIGVPVVSHAIYLGVLAALGLMTYLSSPVPAASQSSFRRAIETPIPGTT